MYNKVVKVSSTVDTDADLIVNESRTVEHKLFGIRISKYAYSRDNKPYEGESLIKKNKGLGFNNK